MGPLGPGASEGVKYWGDQKFSAKGWPPENFRGEKWQPKKKKKKEGKGGFKSLTIKHTQVKRPEQHIFAQYK